MTVSQKIKQCVEIGGAQALFLQHVAHVIDDEIRSESLKEPDQVAHHVSGRVELQVPAQWSHAIGSLQDIAADRLGRFLRTLEQIEANSPYTASMKALQLGVGDIRLNHYHASSAIAGLDESIQQTGIIGPVEARLDNHELMDPEPGHEIAILRQCSIRQRVVRPLDVGIALQRSEYVHVRIPGTGGRYERRLGDALEGTQWQGNQRL